MPLTKKLLTSLAALTAAASIQAATLHWNGAGAADTAAGGNGTWNLVTNNWRTATTAGDASVWTNATEDNAVFGGVAGNVTVAGNLNVNGITFNTAGYHLSGGTLTLTGTTPTINAATNATIASTITGGTLTKSGTGVLTLTGTNTYNGGTELTGGALSFNDAAALGTGYLAIKNSAVLSYTGTGASKLATGTLWFDNGPANLDVTSATGVLTIWRTGGTFSQQLVKTGAGTLRIGANGDNSGASAVVNGGVLESISSTNNNLASITVNNGGTFRLGTVDGAGNAITADHQIWNGGTATINAGGAFDMNGMSETVATTSLAGTGISGSGALFNNGANTATLGGIVALAGNTSIGGSGNITLSGIVNGTNALTKIGTGTLTLSANNTYTGVTTVSAGRLNLNGTNATSIMVGTGATLGGNGSTLGMLTLGTDATLAVGSNAFTANGVTVAGAVNVTFDSPPVTGANSILNYGVGGFTGNVADFSSASARATFSNDSLANRIIATVTTANNTWNTTSGTWDVGTAGNWNNGLDGKFYAGDSVTFNDAGAASVVTLAGTLAPTSVSVNNTAATYTFAGSGAISGTATTLTKSGSGTLIVATNNTYGGATTINAGTLQIGNGGTVGSLGTGAVVNNASLAFNRTDATTVANAISGTGSLTINSGTVAFSTQKTYTGGTTINGGILDLNGAGGAQGTIRGTVTVNTGGTLRLSVNDATGYNGGANALTTINLNGGTLHTNTTANQTLGSAVINMTGASITGIAGSNIDFFGGGSTLNSLASSTTSVISGSSLGINRQGATTITVAAGTTASGIDLDIASVLKTSADNENAGILTKAGAGTLRLRGTNTTKHATVITAGRLITGNNSAFGTGSVTVNAGTLQVGDGTVNSVTLGAGANLVVASGATLKLGSATSTITLNGAGGFTLESGALIDLGGLFDALGGTSTYTLISGGTGTKTGGATVTGYDTNIFSSVTFGNDGTLFFTGAAIPEPSTYGLMGAGVLGAIALVRRRRKTKNAVAAK